MSHHIFQIWVEMAAEMYQRWSLPASTILSGSELVQYKLPNTTLAKKKKKLSGYLFLLDLHKEHYWTMLMFLSKIKMKQLI